MTKGGADSPRLLVGGENGNAIVEFLVLGVLLLVPLLYLVVVLGRLQAASFAVEGAARDGARTVVTAPDDRQAAARLDTVVDLALRDQGFAEPGPSAAKVSLRCSESPCLSAQSAVTVTVRVDVVLPGIPAFVNRAIPTWVPVEGTGRAVVDRFRA